MGSTLTFIEIWIRLLDNNYDTRRVAQGTAMKDMFKKIPKTMTNHLVQDKKYRNLWQRLVVDGICKNY